MNTCNTRLGSFALTLTLAAIGCDAGPTSPAIAPDGALSLADEPDDESSADEPAGVVLAELDLANGNTLTFRGFADGGVAVLEEGADATNALGMLPELEQVTPLELFRAVAPRDMDIPAALVINHDATVAARLAAGAVGTMPAEFRVDEILGFYEAPTERAFKSCTDTLGWQSSTDDNPVGANCPDPSTTLIQECRVGWQPPLVDDCDGLACTETYAPGTLAGFHQMRASVCMRSGSGDVRFHMGIKDTGQAAYAELFDTTLVAVGDYTYAWYSNPVQYKHFTRVLYRTAPDRRVVNKSLWLKR